MKYCYTVFILLTFNLMLSAQLSVTATYSAGDEGIDGQGTFVTVASNSNCAVTLTVPVPAGRFVTGADVEYDLESLGSNWLAEQRSYLECVSTATKEGNLSNGPAINSSGTESYARNNLTLANGIVGASGTLEFKLHAFRTFGFGCNAADARILNNTFKITVRHIAPPTCFQPSGLLVSNTSSTSATLDWTSGGASNWEIEYGAVGFTPGTGTRVAVNSKPFVLTGLTPSTSYDFVVRDSCGVGDVSIWSTALQFQTSCAVTPAPFSENFDGAAWDVSGFNDLGSIDTCWSRNYQNHFTWVKGLPVFISTFTGPSADHTSGSGKYIYSDRVSFGPSPMTARIQSPAIDLSTLTNPQLVFWYHAFGTAMGTLTVEVSDDLGQNFISIQTLVGQQQTSKTAPWSESILDLSAYVNDTVIVQFRVDQPSASTLGEFAIDDFSVEETPTCPKPQDFAVDEVWIDQAQLSFTSANATSWQFEYGTPGSGLGSGTRVVLNANPAVLTGLSPGTDYEVYMRSICGAGDSSVWIGPIDLSTFCNPLTAPYTQDFDNNDFTSGPLFNSPGTIDNCFVRDGVADYVWKGAPSANSLFGTGPDVDHTNGTATGKYVMTEVLNFFVSKNQAQLTTVPIDLSGLSDPELSFWYHMFGNDISSLSVEVLTKNGASSVLTLSGQQQNAKAEAWKERIVPLSAFANDTIAIRFTGNRLGNSFNARISIDDLAVQQAPSCPKPQDLVLVSTTANTATLSWTGGGASWWEVEYGAPGFTPGSGTRVAFSVNPATVTGLTPNTAYAFVVRDSCAVGDVSVWTPPVSGRTDCAAFTAPFTETFDGNTWAPAIGFGTLSTVDACWDRDTTTEYLWSTGQNATPVFNSGPDQDHTTGSGKYLFTREIFGLGLTQNTEAIIESPPIDCTPLTIPELQFWYHMFGTDIDSMAADVFDGTSWTRVWGVAGQQQSNSSDAWLEANVDLGAYTNSTIKVRFRAYRSGIFGFSINMAIDDFKIREQPSCPKPSNLSTTANTTTGVTLSWTSGGASNWMIEYGPPGFAKGSGTFVAANSNPFTVTGLSAGTGYDFYVRDSCGTTDVSDWIGPLTASTLCIPVPAPYLEDFEGSDFVKPSTAVFNDSGSFPVCWDRSISLSYFWVLGPPAFASAFTGPSGDHTSGSGKYAFAESAFGGFGAPFTTSITTPFIDLSPLTVPELSFWYHMFGNGIGSLAVEIDDGGGFTQLTSISAQQQASKTAPWEESIIDLSAYANDTIRLRFVAQKPGFSTAADVAIDDIDIHEKPSCPKPSALNVLLTTTTSVQLDWTSGGATAWEIEYGPVGFAVGGGSGTLLSATTNPFTVTGLSPDTGYDFYVRDDCGGGDVSGWVGPVSDTTRCSVFATPYTEDFEQPEFASSIIFNDPGVISPCFTPSPNTNNYFWRVNTGGTISFNTGPTGDHTSGSGQYIHAEGFTSISTSAIMELPALDISNLSSPELRFWYHLFGNNIQSFEVEGWNEVTQSWQQLSILNGAQQTSNAAAWREEIVSLTSLPNDTISLRLVATRTNNFGTTHDIAIDDIWVGESPNCPRPSNLSFSSSTTTSVSISWTSAGAANALIRYRLSGSTGPFTIIPVTGTSATLTGLQPSSTYEIYVADSCGVGDVSLWLGALQAATQCGVRTLPYSESFDGSQWVSGIGFFNTGDQISSCWTRSTNTGSRWGTRSGPTSSFFSGPDGGFSGKYIFAVNNSFGTLDIDIESEEIAIPATANTPKLFFYYHMFGNDIDSFAIQVNDGSNWSGNVFSLKGEQQNAKTAAWLQDSLDLSGFLGQTIKLRFRTYATGANANIALDQVEIREQSLPCLAPANVAVNNIDANTADVSWTSSGAFSNVILVLAGQPVSSGTVFTNVSSPFALTGLTPNTAYDVYVEDSCGLGSSSNRVLLPFSTLPCPPVITALTITSGGPLTGNFDASATQNADSLYIEFGDGNSSNAPISSNTYASPGVYAITLYGFNDCGNADTLVDTLVVCAVLQPDFVFSQTGSAFTFDASVSLGAAGYNWDFGDGNTSTGMFTAHNYAAPGNYVVTLEVYNACGDTLTTQQAVNVCIKPFASWTYTIVSTSSAGMLVQFDATASLNATDYEWVFGDGNTASGTAVPLHTYLVPSLSYNVRLIVSNACGGSDTLAYRLSQIGLEETEWAQRFAFYPIPANEQLSVTYPADAVKIHQVKLYDLNGRTLNTPVRKGDKGLLYIDLSTLPNGMYGLYLETDRGILRKKVQVQR